MQSCQASCLPTGRQPVYPAARTILLQTATCGLWQLLHSATVEVGPTVEIPKLRAMSLEELPQLPGSST